jgi:hypothetical protein
MKRALCIFVLVVTALLVSFPLSTSAKVDLVTIPGRESVQITIYNSEDLTLVKEQRQMTFKKGLNQIQFSWAGTLIDPTSLNLVFNEHPEQFHILDITYPADTANVLIWNVESSYSGLVPIEITYFTSGLTWSADYVVRANPEETKMRLEGYVTVTNRSGEDYENTQTRLLVGEIHLVEKIADLARAGVKELKRLAVADMIARAEIVEKEAVRMARPKEIVKEGISEYFLYTVEGRETIKNEWSKRLPSFAVDDIPFTLTYEHDDAKYGSNVVKFYKLKNDEKSHLGKEPLPDGAYNVFKSSGNGGLTYINKCQSKYIPVGEDIELNLGPDGLITVEPKRMDFQRKEIVYDSFGNVRGWDIVEEWKIEMRNSKSVDVPLEITRHFQGDWEIKSQENFERKDKNTIQYKVVVPALATRVIQYTVTTHHGLRSKQS